MNVTVSIFYLGKYRQITGKAEEEIEVPEMIKQAFERIIDHLKTMYGITPPFNLMVNGSHVIGAIKKGMVLKDKDIFNLIPFITGG